MGKKSRKAKQRKYFGCDLSNGRKKSKKNKGSKTVGYKEPKLKSLKPTLDKKEIKTNKKIVMSPVDVPKEFIKNRQKCNHAGALMTVTEFKNMTPNWAAYTPALERMVEMYGEESVRVCRQCYDVLVDRNKVDSDKVSDALTVLYAACNMAVANKRLKDDEVKHIAKLKGVIDDFRPVMEVLDKIAEEEAEVDRQTSNGNRNLNQVPGSTFVQ